MRRDQFYTKLDTYKLALSSVKDILGTPKDDSKYDEESIALANKLNKKVLEDLESTLRITDFEQLTPEYAI